MFLKTPFLSVIPRRSAVCAEKGEVFQPSTEYASFLSMQEEEWKRNDYCIKCWQAIEKEKQSEGCYWFGKIPSKKEIPVSQDDKVLTLFRELSAQVSEYEHQKIIVILALYLERMKLIERRSEMKERRNPALRYYEILETGEIIPVIYCSLSREDSEKIIQQIKQRLS